MSLVIDYSTGFFEATPSGEGVGSISGNATLDLTSGNVFSHTPSANTTFAFSNPPASGTGYDFTMKVTGANVVDGYDLANASYDSVSFSVTGDGADVYFKPDGTAFFSTDISSKIYKYSMTTAWDLSTASYTGSSLSASKAFGLYFKTDGTRLFFINNTSDSVNQVDLSTAWDLSTAGTVVAGAPTVGTIVRGIRFSLDGTKMYAADRPNTQIEQFNLSTAWDISSSSASSTPSETFSVGAQASQPAIYAFNPDGTKMWVTDTGNDSIYEYSLSTAWSVSSASYSSISFGLSSQDATPIGGQFKSDGTKMYVVGSTTDTIYQYSTGSSAAATIAYPSSVEWPSGTAPAAPASGETDVYTFFTTDNGSTYYGNQVGDAVS